MKTIKHLLILLFYCFLLAACTLEEDTYAPISMEVNKNEILTPYPIPDSDIVFLFGTRTDVNDTRAVFLYADGTEEAHFQHGLSIVYDQIPTWTDDGKYVFIPNPADFINVFTKEGHKLIRGLRADLVIPIHGTSEILAESSINDFEISAIKRVNIETGEIIDIYPLNDEYDGMQLGTNSFHDQKLIYTRWRNENATSDTRSEIVIYDTDKKKEHIIGGDYSKSYPSYSPDGAWIAYTGTDWDTYENFISLVQPDGSENHKIIENILSYWLPAVSWSPDGKWIVYHRCTLNSKNDCDSRYENQAIFKYNLETGEEIMLAKNGIFPYWRWRKESP